MDVPSFRLLPNAGKRFVLSLGADTADNYKD